MVFGAYNIILTQMQITTSLPGPQHENPSQLPNLTWVLTSKKIIIEALEKVILLCVGKTNPPPLSMYSI